MHCTIEAVCRSESPVPPIICTPEELPARKPSSSTETQSSKICMGSASGSAGPAASTSTESPRRSANMNAKRFCLGTGQHQNVRDGGRILGTDGLPDNATATAAGELTLAYHRQTAETPLAM